MPIATWRITRAAFRSAISRMPRPIATACSPRSRAPCSAIRWCRMWRREPRRAVREFRDCLSGVDAREHRGQTVHAGHDGGEFGGYLRGRWLQHGGGHADGAHRGEERETDAARWDGVLREPYGVARHDAEHHATG